MKRLVMILIASLVSSIFSFSNYSPVSAGSIELAEVEAFIDKAIQEKMEELHLPNATVSIVADGEVIMEKGYGFADLEKQIPVDANETLFRMGSISKVFTWTAVMQLVEQGKLDLDADVNQYLDFEIPSQLVNSSGHAETAPITLTHLMTHTPGFEDYPESVYSLSPERFIPLHDYIRNDLPARVFPSGEVVAYSNYGTALAGYIVERVSAQPFSEYIDEHIFTPLEMNHSTFRQPIQEELSGKMAKAYRYVDGDYRKGDFEFVPEPAGGMSSSASDMARFMIAYLQGGTIQEERILEEETVRLMQTQQFTHHPRLDGMAYGFKEGTINEQRFLFHGGNTMLYDTGLYLLPEQNVGIFVSYSGGNYSVHSELFQQFMDRYFPSLYVMTQSPPDGTIERSKQLIGEYHQNRKSFTTPESFVSLTMGMIQIDVDQEGYLLATHIGETNRFVEIEPGIYQNLQEDWTQDPYGAFRTLVFDTDPFGRTMLIADGPMTYSKAPWYATSTFTFQALIIALLFIVGSLIYWSIMGVVRMVRRRKVKYPGVAVAARWLAIFYAILTLGFVFGFVIVGEFDPVYQLPKVAFGLIPDWSSVVDLIPVLMAFIGAVIVIFVAFAWWKGYWRTVARIHYTLYASATLVLLWMFSYWNIL